ncbi:NADAR family protein [Rhodococcus erythropolis]
MEQRTWQLGALPIPIINAFVGEHEYMSNLYPAPTLHRGQLFPSSEHAYAAAKSSDPTVIRAILATDDPAEAKKIGRSATLVEGWEASKFRVMESVVTSKFVQNHDLADRLRSTGGSLIVEGNVWHDQIWGSCSCSRHRDVPGGNALGVILMAVRMRMVE